MLSMLLALAAAYDGRLDMVCLGQSSVNTQMSSSAWIYDNVIGKGPSSGRGDGS